MLRTAIIDRVFPAGLQPAVRLASIENPTVNSETEHYDALLQPLVDTEENMLYNAHEARSLIVKRSTQCCAPQLKEQYPPLHLYPLSEFVRYFLWSCIYGGVTCTNRRPELW